MPLRDHFRQPLSPRRHWQGFHSAWATALAWDLNGRLPERYFAEPNVHFGIEIDVATWEEIRKVEVASPAAAGAGDRVAVAGWTPPAPTLSVPFTLITDVVEVAVYSTEAGPILVGAIELVSPANKDRPEHREAFVAKCRTYLQEGVGLLVTDIVTERRASLHAELLAATSNGEIAPSPDLYATAYRPVGDEDRTALEVWIEGLTIGGSLPTLPLWLRGGPCLPVDLESTYERTCREMRIP